MHNRLLLIAFHACIFSRMLLVDCELFVLSLQSYMYMTVCPFLEELVAILPSLPPQKIPAQVSLLPPRLGMLARARWVTDSCHIINQDTVPGQDLKRVL